MIICMISASSSSLVNFRRDLIQQIIEKGNTLYVLCSDYTDETRSIIKELGAIPFDCRLKRSSLNPLLGILEIIQLTKKINQLNPDIVFSYFSKPVAFGTLAARLARVPRVIGMLEGLGASFTPAEGEKSLQRLKLSVIKAAQLLIYRISLPLLNRLVFLNTDDPIEIIEKHRIKVNDYKILGGIGLALDKHLYSIPPTGPVVFIFIGRLLKNKGIYEFINAAKFVKKQHPNSKFIMLGTIDKHNPSSINEAQLNELLKEGLVTCPGHVNNPQEWIKTSSVFVLPSYREGLPRSTQEAMALGRAIITTDVPGCRETVEEGVNGFLVSLQNTEALAQKMIFFIENPEQIILMGKKSRDKAEKEFCAITQAEKLYDFIVND